MDVVVQYEVYWITLDPTVGSEINKTRPGVVISPEASNRHLNTVLIAPVTSTIRKFPMRVNVALNGKKGQVALDQIRCVDKSRISDKLGKLSTKEEEKLRQTLQEYLID